MAYVTTKLGKKYQIPDGGTEPAGFNVNWMGGENWKQRQIEQSFGEVQKGISGLLSSPQPLTAIGESRLQDYLSEVSYLEKATGKSFGFGNTPITPPTTSPTLTATPKIDYTLRQGESIDAYNARIATVRAGNVAPTASPTKVISPQDYQLKQGENIDAYNTRIAALRGETQKQADDLALTPPSGVGRGSYDFLTKAKELMGGQTAPAQKNLVEQYKEYQTQYLDPLQGEYDTAKADLANIQNTILAEADKFKGEQVSSAVINRKLVKLDADMAESLRQATSKVQSAADRLDNKTKTISTLMSLTQQDYANTRSDYEFNYNKNIQLLGLIQIEQNKERNDAQASLKTIWDTMEKNGTSFDTLSQDQKLTIQDLELKSGYPLGFSDFVGKNVQGEKVSVNSYTGADGQQKFDILLKKSGGGYEVQTVAGGVGEPPEPTPDIKAENYDQVKQEATILFEIDRQRNADKKIRPDLYQAIRNKIPATLKDDFDKWAVERGYLSEETIKKYTTLGEIEAKPETVAKNKVGFVVDNMIKDNISIEEINNYIRAEGYNPDDDFFNKKLEEYKSQEKKPWWQFWN